MNDIILRMTLVQFSDLNTYLGFAEGALEILLDNSDIPNEKKERVMEALQRVFKIIDKARIIDTSSEKQ